LLECLPIHQFSDAKLLGLLFLYFPCGLIFSRILAQPPA
jgi:sulfite exporter TauE/SafE